ncbi:MAG TPA: hypothetical protein VH475_25310 [Tepidisphaeraceae bacterium]|jgi:hypothetical protein
MRRNGQSSESAGYECSSSSGWTNTFLSLAGGIGLGAGLLYLLDPDKGQRRRQQILDSASDMGRSLADRVSSLASSASDYAGDTARGYGKSARRFAGDRADDAGGMISGAIGSVRDFVGDKFGGARDYASDKLEAAKDLLRYQIDGETKTQRRIGQTICALSSMALGAALMYVFDPSMGRSRRRYVREQAGNLANQAGQYASQATQSVGKQASNLASQAGDAIKSGYNQAKEKVTDAVSNMTSPDKRSSSSGSISQPCPPGMVSTTGPGTTPNVGRSTTL